MTQTHRTISIRRRGSIYIAVLGTALIASTLAVGGILATRVQMRAAESGADAAEARIYAQSGMELAKYYISQDANWRTNRSNGDWYTGLTIGSGGTISINVVDPSDGDLTNRPYDAVQLTVTAQKGLATQILRQTLTASPTPLPALAYAIHTGGQLHVSSGDHLVLGTGTASTNGSLKNDETIEGCVSAASVSKSGVVYGSLSSGVASKAMPDSTLAESYAKLGTLLSTAPNTIDKQVFGPGRNPYGTANADGVYVIRSSSNITIRNTRVYGTLVIIAPNKTVTLDTSVLFQPARSDYPSLIVNGDVVMQLSGASSGLSESTNAVNFNPAGAPYNGVSDSDTADTYPCEIDGLMHVTGSLTVNQPATIRGAIICESAANTDAVAVKANLQVIYDANLFTSPPQFYTTSVKMVPLAGSVKQIVN